MDMQPIEPNQALTATLTAQEWNSVMAALNELPHRIARPIFDKLGQQLQQQSQGVNYRGNEVGLDRLHADTD